MRHEHDTNTIILNRNELRALLKFASKDEARDNIRTVAFAFDEDRSAAAATDGHALVVCRIYGDAAEIPESWHAVPREYLDQIYKVMKSKDELSVRLDGDNDDDEIVLGYPTPMTGIREDRVTVGRPFPPVSAVLNNGYVGKGKAGRVGLGLSLVAKVTDALAKVHEHAKSKDPDAATWTTGKTDLDPVLVNVPGNDGCTWDAVIMPCRL